MSYEVVPSGTRTRRVIAAARFAGTIQSDGYALYGAMEQDRAHLRRVGCWAHARSKFHKVISDDAARAKEIIALIAPLYGIEKVPRESALSAEARK